MTTRQLVRAAGEHPLVLIAALVRLPVLNRLDGRCHAAGNGGRAPWK